MLTQCCLPLDQVSDEKKNFNIGICNWYQILQIGTKNLKDIL